MSQSPQLRTVMSIGAVATAVSIGIVVATADSLTSSLQTAYPDRSATAVAEAQSSILTYLFTLLGLGLISWGVLALGRAKEWAWTPHLATAVFVIGTAAMVYNFGEPHPLAMTLGGLIPSLVGLVAVILLWRTRPMSQTLSAPAR